MSRTAVLVMKAVGALCFLPKKDPGYSSLSSPKLSRLSIVRRKPDAHTEIQNKLGG